MGAKWDSLLLLSIHFSHKGICYESIPKCVFACFQLLLIIKLIETALGSCVHFQCKMALINMLSNVEPTVSTDERPNVPSRTPSTQLSSAGSSGSHRACQGWEGSGKAACVNSLHLGGNGTLSW